MLCPPPRRRYAVERGRQPGLQPLARLLLRSGIDPSSKVEGMQVDARSLARAEALDLGQTIGADVVEVLANIDAMELADRRCDCRRDAPTSTTSSRRTASCSQARRMPRRSPGSFGANRTGSEATTSIRAAPCSSRPHPSTSSRLLADLIGFCNAETPTAARSGGLRTRAVRDDPSVFDGNGRTGRALVQVILRRRGLAADYVPPISVVLAADKPRYLQGLVDFREARENDWLTTSRTPPPAPPSSPPPTSPGCSGFRTTGGKRSRYFGFAPSRRLARHRRPPGPPDHLQPVAVKPPAALARSCSRRSNQLVAVGVLVPLSENRRNRQWEAAGLSTSPPTSRRSMPR